MAISRHKVLSEMQQQLELASSKCGSLQKQLEIVKDKVRKTSSTNITQFEPQDEKENKVKNGELMSGLTRVDEDKEYRRSSPLSSSSSIDGNDDSDVNIIKAFYERLGQMDYSPGRVELSDVTSEGNDQSVDQMWTGSSLPRSKSSKKDANKSKEKKALKKSNENKSQIYGSKKKKETKTTPASPYENHLTKALKLSPTKTKNVRSKQKSVRAKENLNATHKTGSKSNLSKTIDFDRLKRNKVISAGRGPYKNESYKGVQEPITKGNNLTVQLRKTKSTTLADKKDAFQDTRSLTRLVPNKPPEPIKETPKSREAQVEKTVNGLKWDKVLREATRIERTLPPNAVKEATPKKISNEKGTSISDLATALKPEKTLETLRPSKFPSINTPAEVSVSKPPPPKRDTVVKTPMMRTGKATNNEGVRPRDVNVTTSKKKPVPPPVKGDKNEKVKNGPVVPTVREQEPPKWEVKKKVNLFEIPMTNKKLSMEDIKSLQDIRDNMSSKLKENQMPVTRSFRQSTAHNEGPSEPVMPRISSSVNSIPMEFQCDPSEKDTEYNPLGLAQIRRMRDNLMKFNAIPFIVGQSTTKSYHIGLNIQQTYSLFKQTPSMTALRAAKLVDGEFASQCRAKSARTGTERSFRTTTREMCPACDSAPEKTPEQLADPWAVPQDDDKAVVRVCTCMPRKIISFDQVLNQLYFTDMNLVKLHPSFIQSEENTDEQVKDLDKPAGPRSTNTMNYTKLLRSIQNLKERISGNPD